MWIEPANRDHYRILGVRRDASMHEIRRAYRRLARQHHPDISPQPRDGAYFTALTAAYEVLHDPDKRARYDQASPPPDKRDLRPGSEWQHPRWVEPNRGASAGGASRPVRERDRRAVLELTPREAAQLATRAITIQAGGYVIELPAGIRAGQQIRLIGAGERGWRGGPPGDLLLTVEMPTPSATAAGASLIDLLFSSVAASHTSILFSAGRFTWQ